MQEDTCLLMQVVQVTPIFDLLKQMKLTIKSQLWPVWLAYPIRTFLDKSAAENHQNSLIANFDSQKPHLSAAIHQSSSKFGIAAKVEVDIASKHIAPGKALFHRLSTWNLQCGGITCIPALTPTSWFEGCAIGKTAHHFLLQGRSRYVRMPCHRLKVMFRMDGDKVALTARKLLICTGYRSGILQFSSCNFLF